jgi:hypothetical protein
MSAECEERHYLLACAARGAGMLAEELSNPLYRTLLDGT